MITSPNKHTSLETLQNIRQDNYIAKSGQEYSAEEVDLMITEKKVLEAEKFYLQMIKEEFSQAEQDQIIETMEANGDRVLANDFGLVVIEGSKIADKTIIATYAVGTKDYTKKKPQKRYSTKTELRAWKFALECLNHVKGIGEYRVERAMQRKQDKQKMINSINAGDILYSSWGYEQTNVDFYKVISKKGTKVQLQKCSEKRVEGSEKSWASCEVTCGEPYGEIKTYTIGTYGVKINYSVTLTPWNGKPTYCSWYY